MTIHGNLKPIVKYYCTFDDANKRILEDATVKYLNTFNRALVKILSEIPTSLSSILEMRKEAAKAKDLELREHVLSSLCPVISNKEADKFFKEVKNNFRSKTRMNKLMIGDIDEVVKEIK